MKQVVLLTGRPGSGKTSLVKQVAARIEGKAGGFYTEEVRNRGVRDGFKLVTLDGKEITLAHVDIRSPYRVGKYGVDVAALDRVGVPALRKAARRFEVVIIDEIGKMELLSDSFREAVSEIINGSTKVLGTIMLTPNPWADAIKRQPHIDLITLTRANYQEVLVSILGWLTEAKSP
ncbi:MAG: NTPase [Chloroflexi bacterium]|nr:NTPase [Chloroflexota bacterium]